jgi:hypothetical protein
MKRKMVKGIMKTPMFALPLVAFALMSTGCFVENDSAIKIRGAYALSSEASADGCDINDDIEIYRGNLDLAASQNFTLMFKIISNLQVIETTVNGEIIEPGNRNDFYGEQMVFNYTSTPALPFTEEIVPVHFLIEPSSESQTVLNLLAPLAVETLWNNLVPGESVELGINFLVQGRLASGQRLSTSSVTYPISVYKSGFAGCPFGVRMAPTGPCGSGGGQNGSLPACCDSTDPLIMDLCGT